MATTIKEFIEYLKTLPEDTELCVVRGYYIDYSFQTEEVPLEIDVNTEFVDFTGNPYVKEDSNCFNKKYLNLGEL